VPIVSEFLGRSKRCGFCPPDMPDFNQLLEDDDDQLFERILNNPHHKLYQLLPPQSAASQNYNLRRRIHERQLHEHQGHLSDCDFITTLYCTKIHTDSITYIYVLQTVISLLYRLYYLYYLHEL